jgi:hypothetical protein
MMMLLLNAAEQEMAGVLGLGSSFDSVLLPTHRIVEVAMCAMIMHECMMDDHDDGPSALLDHLLDSPQSVITKDFLEQNAIFDDQWFDDADPITDEVVDWLLAECIDFQAFFKNDNNKNDNAIALARMHIRKVYVEGGLDMNARDRASDAFEAFAYWFTDQSENVDCFDLVRIARASLAYRLLRKLYGLGFHNDHNDTSAEIINACFRLLKKLK